MNVRLPGTMPLIANPIPFAGRLPHSHLSAGLQADQLTKGKKPITGKWSLAFRWVKMSLDLIKDGFREGRALQRQVKSAVRKGKK